MASFTGTEGDKEITYSCNTTGIGYAIIIPEIREQFNFLINEMPEALQEVENYLNKAAAITDGFDFDGENNIQKSTDILNKEIENTKTQLRMLYDAFMKDIDNVNAELQTNYGWVIGGYLNKKEWTKTETQVK